MEKEFREFLREKGLPDDPTEGGKIYPFRSHVTPELEEESDEWYAAMILDDLSERKQALKEKHYIRAEILGGRAVYLFSEALHKPDVIKGEKYGTKQSAIAKKSVVKRQAALAKRNQQLREMAEEIRSNRSDMSERSIARLLYHDQTKPGGKLSENRIREIIKPS